MQNIHSITMQHGYLTISKELINQLIENRKQRISTRLANPQEVAQTTRKAKLPAKEFNTPNGSPGLLFSPLSERP